MSDPIEITEDVYYAVATPVAVFATVALVAGQIDAIGEIEADDLDGLSHWPDRPRERLISDVRDSLDTIRQFVADVDAILPAPGTAE